jgi:hypothetical protein
VRAIAEDRHLREVLQSEAGLPLGRAELDSCFDQAVALRHARRAVDALDDIG